MGSSGKEGCAPVSHSALGQDSVGIARAEGPVQPERPCLYGDVTLWARSAAQ